MQIFPKSKSDTKPGNAAAVRIPVGPFERQAAVFISAHGVSHYKGTVANAGMVLTITVNDHTVRDDSFEGESSNMIYQAAASHMLVLEPLREAVIMADVAPMGAGGASNHDTFVDLHVIALTA